MYTYKRFKTSKSILTILLIALALVAWASLGYAVKPDKPQRDDGGKYIHLNVTFEESGSERITSDGNGPYCDGEDNVMALAYKRFRLDTTRGAGRTVTLDFGEHFEENPIEENPIKVEVDMRLCRKFTEDDAADGFLAELPNLAGMIPDEMIRATMGISFVYRDQLYAVGYGNPFQWLDEIPEGAEEADPVTVRCISEGEWEIEAALHAQAILYSVDWKNGNVECGYFNMPFTAKLVKQTKRGGKKAPPASNLSSELTSTWGEIKADR